MACRICFSMRIRSLSRLGLASFKKGEGYPLAQVYLEPTRPSDALALPAAHPGPGACFGAVGHRNPTPPPSDCSKNGPGSADEAPAASKTSTLPPGSLHHPRGSPVPETGVPCKVVTIRPAPARKRVRFGEPPPVSRSTLHRAHTAVSHPLPAAGHRWPKSSPHTAEPSPPVLNTPPGWKLPAEPESDGKACQRCVRC